MKGIIKELNLIIKEISINHKIVDTNTMLKLYDVREKLKALIIPDVVCSSVLKQNKNMIDREHTEIFDQVHQMYAEGTSNNLNELEPTKEDIENLLDSEGFKAYKIEIEFDNMQKFWRWNCKISKI